MSEVYTKYKTGPNILLCATPAVIDREAPKKLAFVNDKLSVDNITFQQNCNIISKI